MCFFIAQGNVETKSICCFYVDEIDKLVLRFFYNYCPGKEAALVSIVVSLPCTAYLCGTFTGVMGRTSLFFQFKNLIH